MKRRTRALHIIMGALAGLAVLVAPASPVFANGNGGKGGGHDNDFKPTCTRQTLPVKLTPGENTSTYEMVGWLCAKGSPAGKPLQLLVHGLTYDHNYWDFPFQGEKYSYVQKATKSGFATFAIDRIGTGQSSRAPASEVTFPAQANTMLQVVDALKTGKVGGTKFEKIIGVGHSMGAGIWMMTAEQNPKAVDGLILLDYLHQTNPVTQAALADARYPAKSDPKFANTYLPDVYFTTKPDTRELYYNMRAADKRVIAEDEKYKETTTSGELETLAQPRDSRYSKQIKVPVLLIVGEKDSLFCNEKVQGLSCKNDRAVKNREAQFYSPEARLKVEVIENAGHVTNLHYNAYHVFAKANDWAGHVIK